MEVDLSKRKGHRIVSLKVLCTRCPVHTKSYEDLDDNMKYNVAIISYLANGGGKGGDKRFLKEEKLEHIEGPLDIDVFEEYLRFKSPINEKVDKNNRRIKVLTGNPNNNNSAEIPQILDIFLIASVALSILF